MSGPDLNIGLPLFTFETTGYQMIDAREFVKVAGSRDYRPRAAGNIKRISIHHSAGSEPTNAEDSLATLLAIANFHVHDPEHLWPGIAYHVCIDAEGRAFYTGDWLTSRFVVGDDNPFNLAICYLGKLTDHHPTPAAKATFRRVIGEFQFASGWHVPYMGHRDTPGTLPTECPGAVYAEWIWEINPQDGAQAEQTFLVVPTAIEEDYIRAVTAAPAYGIDVRLGVGLIIAESAFDRYARRPLDSSRDPDFWPDVSAGLCQQTVAWSDELRAYGLSPWVYPGEGITAEILGAYYDPDHSIDVGFSKLAHYRGSTDNDLDALCLYNGPGLPVEENPNREAYRKALVLADRLLTGELTPAIFAVDR